MGGGCYGVQVPVEIGKLPLIELFNIEENKACKAPPPEVIANNILCTGNEWNRVRLSVQVSAVQGALTRPTCPCDIGDRQGVCHCTSLLPRFSQGGWPQHCALRGLCTLSHRVQRSIMMRARSPGKVRLAAGSSGPGARQLSSGCRCLP